MATKYFKDNILGLTFTVADNEATYTIDTFVEDSVIITWGETNSTDYFVEDVLHYLNKGTWKVISPSINLSYNYLIL